MTTSNTAPNSNILEEHITEKQAPVTNNPQRSDENSVPQPSKVTDDSITHQAGDGKTEGLPASMETPDIFDNSPQAEVKPQSVDQEQEQVQVDEGSDVATTKAAEKTSMEDRLQARNETAPFLDTLSDGSVDIPRV